MGNFLLRSWQPRLRASDISLWIFCQRQVSVCLPHAHSVCTLHSAHIIIFIFTSRNHPNHGNFNLIQTSPVRLAKLLANTNRGNYPLELATRLLTSHQHRCLSACLSILFFPPLTSRWLIIDDGHKLCSQEEEDSWADMRRKLSWICTRSTRAAFSFSVTSQMCVTCFYLLHSDIIAKWCRNWSQSQIHEMSIILFFKGSPQELVFSLT